MRLNPEVVHSVLLESANRPSLAAKSAFKMEEMYKGELLLKVVEEYSRPTRIVRMKTMDFNAEVDESTFEIEEERAPWIALLSVEGKVHHGVELESFFEA